MKKVFSTVCLTLGLGILIYAQPHSYQQTINVGGDDYANMSIPGDNHSHYLVGSTSANGGGDYDAFIEQVDSNGHSMWEKQYGGSGTEYGTALIRTSDNNLLLVGRTSSYSSSTDIFVVKTDLSGNVIWAKSIGTDSTDFANNVSEGPLGYLVTGQTQGSQAGPGRWDIPLIMLDVNGNMLWSKSFGFQFGNEVGYDVKSLDSDGWIVMGYTGVNNIGLNDGLFFGIDTTGALQGTFEVGDSSDEDIRRGVMDLQTGKSVYMVGNTRSFHVAGGQDIFIAKYDVSQQAPSLLWFKTYGDSGEESVTDAQMTPDGQIVVTALSDSYPGGDNGLVFMTDTNGTVLMTKVLGGSGDDVAMGIEISDNPVIAGYSNSFDGGGDNDLYLVAPDMQMNFGCHSYDTTLTAVTRTVSTLGPVINDFSISPLTVNVTSPTNLTHSNTPTDSTLCDTVSVGIHEINGVTNLTLFPNPTQQNINVSFNLPASGKLSYRIVNIFGSVIYSEDVLENKGVINHTFNVSQLAAGAYFLKIDNDGSSITKPFMIVR